MWSSRIKRNCKILKLSPGKKHKTERFSTVWSLVQPVLSILVLFKSTKEEDFRFFFYVCADENLRLFGPIQFPFCAATSGHLNLRRIMIRGHISTHGTDKKVLWCSPLIKRKSKASISTPYSRCNPTIHLRKHLKNFLIQIDH